MTKSDWDLLYLAVDSAKSACKKPKGSTGSKEREGGKDLEQSCSKNSRASVEGKVSKEDKTSEKGDRLRQSLSQGLSQGLDSSDFVNLIVRAAVLKRVRTGEMRDVSEVARPAPARACACLRVPAPLACLTPAHLRHT